MTPPSLIETLRQEPGTGLVRLDRHLARLSASARLFGFAGLAEAEAALTGLAPTDAPLRVRLELFADGRLTLATAPFAPLPDGQVWRTALAGHRLSSANPLLAHKTSLRADYDAARAEFSRETIDEVILLNEAGEVCEGTITSVFADDGSGGLLTPPLASGLLAGVLRAELIDTGRAREARLSARDLAARPFYLGNSLRGLIAARLA